MKENRHDWTDAVRAALRDAEAAPPARGWERLERALLETGTPLGAAGGARAAAPRWRVLVRRGLAVAATLLLALAGGYLWRAGDRLPAGLPAGEMLRADVAGVESDAEAVGEAETAIAQRMSEALAGEGAAGVRMIAASDAPRRAKGSHGAVGEADPASPAAQDRLSESVPGAGASAGQLPEEPRPSEKRSAAPDAARAEARENAPKAADRTSPVRTNPDRTSPGRKAASRARAGAERRSSFAFHAAGMPGGGGGGAMREFLSDAPVLSPMISAAVDHAPGDVVTHVVRALPSALQAQDYRHRQPVSAGIAFRRAFAYGLSLETGVNYTLLRSDVVVGGAEIGQRLHFVGVPLRLDWQFLERGPLSLYIGAGGQVETCVAARFGERSVDEPGVQWSLAVVAGAQCRLGGPVGLYFEPEASWYLNDTRLRTSRTDRPTTFTLRLGMRFSF